jgi:hypothetical protein
MNYIYAQTEQCKFWFDNSNIKNYSYNDDFTSWKTQPGKRIALLELQYLDEDTANFVKQCIEFGHLVLLFVPEFIDDDWCRQFDCPNVVLFLAGRLNWTPVHAKTADCMYFFWSTLDFYKTYPELLEYTRGSENKYFDVLLGRRKPHRSAIYQNIDLSKNIVRYFPHNEDADIRNYDATHGFSWPIDVLPKPNEKINFTVQEVIVNGVIVSLSQIIPREIYQQTHYTLVAETQNENGFSFFTEKIAKPILAKRLFLVASGQYYLRNLRDLGFQTFGDIIDESYDHEPNADRRIKMLLKQVDYLCTQDPQDILSRAHSILEHNYYVMTHVDWQGSIMKKIHELV